MNSCLAVSWRSHRDEESAAETCGFAMAESRGTKQAAARTNGNGFCLCCSHRKNHGSVPFMISVGAWFGGPVLPLRSHVIQNQACLSAQQRGTGDLQLLKAGLLVGNARQSVAG